MSLGSKLESVSSLLVAAVGAAGCTEWQAKAYIIAAIVTVALVWFTFALLAFVFTSRRVSSGGEKFRLSLGFSFLTLVSPFFVSVPLCLNAL